MTETAKPPRGFVEITRVQDGWARYHRPDAIQSIETVKSGSGGCYVTILSGGEDHLNRCDQSVAEIEDRIAQARTEAQAEDPMARVAAALEKLAGVVFENAQGYTFARVLSRTEVSDR